MSSHCSGPPLKSLKQATLLFGTIIGTRKDTAISKVEGWFQFGSVLEFNVIKRNDCKIYHQPRHFLIGYNQVN